MEKPAPALQFERYGLQKIRGTALRNRYVERMIARGIPVVTDAPDETDKPVWRGDHAFSSDAASYSLMHFVEPEVATEHPDWGMEKVKAEARDRFTRRLEQDLSYEHKESNHEETLVHWKPVVTWEGKTELATEYGGSVITLRELWEHTKEYAAFVGNPAAYNPQEEQAQMHMQDEFIHGSSTGFLTVLSHPDAVRYVQVWEKTTDGDVVSKQVDLFAATGTDFSKMEGDQLVRHVASYYNAAATDGASGSFEYAHVFIEHGTMDDQHIRIIAKGMVMHQEHGVSETKEPAFISAFSMEKKIVTDTRDSLVILGTYLHRQINEKLRVLQLADHRNIHQKESSRQPVVHKEVVHTASYNDTQTRRIDTKSELGVIHDGMHEVQVLPETHQAMQNMMAEWYVSQMLITRAKDVPVGAHAVLFWFSVLESQRSQPQPQIEKRTVAQASVHSVIHAKVSELRAFFVGLPDRVRLKKTFKKLIPEIRQRLPVSLIKMESLTYRPLKRIAVYFDRLKEHIFGHKNPNLIFSASQDMPMKKCSDSHISITTEPKLVIDTKEQRELSIHQIQVGIMVWYLLLAEEGEQQQGTHRIDVSHEFKRMLSSLAGRPREENTAVSVSSPWVLLAIVRYLSLLRESGQAGPKIKAVSVRAKRKRCQHMYDGMMVLFLCQKISRPIIFTFAS